MNILNKLTIKSLKMNKRRTIVTIFGIILSTAMICAAGALVTSARQTEIESAKKEEGDYHSCFYGVLKENLKYIEENRNIESYYSMEGLGYSVLPESKNAYKPYLYLLAADDTVFQKASLELTEGRFPKDETEVVLTETIRTGAKVEYQLGDVLSLSISKRESDGYELDQMTPYLNQEAEEEKDLEEKGKEGAEEEIKSEQETLVEQYKKEVTIVGFIKRPNYSIEPYSAPGYSVITRQNEIAKKADIYISFHKPRNTVKYTENIEATLEKYQDVKQNYNHYLIRWLGAVSNDTQIFLYTIGTIVIGIIMVASIFVIRNSFAISITERMKQYGMLASIGATSKQIRKNVLFEGFLLGIAAIPFGVFSGIVAVFILISVVNNILKDVFEHPIICYVSVVPVIAAVFLSIVTIYFSAFSSARQAAKVAPLQAIRSNQDIKMKAKHIKSPKFIKKWFGIGGEIAYKNLKRNRKKYRATVISMVVSIVLFLSMYSFIEYSYRYSGSYYQRVSYNLMVSLTGNNLDFRKTYKQHQELGKLEGIEEYSIVRHNRSYHIKEHYLSDLGKEIAEKNFVYDSSEYGTMKQNGENTFSPSFVSVGEAEYKAYLKKLGLKDLGENGAVLIEVGYHRIGFDSNAKKVYGNFYNLKEGDTVVGESEDGDKISLQIKKVTQERPMGLEENRDDMGYFVVSDQWMDQTKYGNYNLMYLRAEDVDTLETKLEEVLKKGEYDYYIGNLEESRRQQNAQVLVIEIFLYGFITVITLIGVTNIFNTITGNVNLRRRELAMLRSVGMTQKEFRGMIRLESIFYGAKALFLGLPIGTILSFLIYKTFNDTMEMSFQIPWKIYLISIIFTMAIVGLTMYYSFSKIKNENIMETIRKETI